MRKDAIHIEEARVSHLEDISDYTSIHERHRIFPAVFENREHKKIIDVGAGVGVVGKRIMDYYSVDALCNDISPACLNIMKKAGLRTISFDIDDANKAFPFADGSFDAVIALATMEHVINIDHFVEELYRILSEDGYLYMSVPNYSGLLLLLPFLLTGKTFHDPLSEHDRYEFYAHVRYFTYRTLIEFAAFFGFTPDSVYLPIPDSSSKFFELKSKSKLKAAVFRLTMKYVYRFFGPRWASEPVICFRKCNKKNGKPIKKII
jgi:SAM-dependent methyltransferase